MGRRKAHGSVDDRNGPHRLREDSPTVVRQAFLPPQNEGPRPLSQNAGSEARCDLEPLSQHTTPPNLHNRTGSGGCPPAHRATLSFETGGFPKSSLRLSPLEQSLLHLPSQVLELFGIRALLDICNAKELVRRFAEYVVHYEFLEW